MNFYINAGRGNDLLIYACTSGYPVEFQDVCLLEINKLKEKYIDSIGGIGFSGHHLGIAVDIAAITLGASWIERHFTMDRTWKGTDHAASLEPEGLRKLSRDMKNVDLALTYKPKDILDVEEVQRKKIKVVSKQLVCIIPARGGSKGIKNKNLEKINGKSLIARSIEVYKNSKYIDEVYVSSDSKKNLGRGRTIWS